MRIESSKKQSCTKIPYVIFDMMKKNGNYLSLMDFAVLCAFLSLNQYHIVTAVLLAGELPICRKTVLLCLKRLREGGFLIKTSGNHYKPASALTKTTDHFYLVPTSLFRVQNMDINAIGLYSLLLKYPDDWVFSTDKLCRDTSSALYTIRKAANTLEKNHYLLRTRIFTDKCKNAGSVYSIFLNPEDYEKQAPVIKAAFSRKKKCFPKLTNNVAASIAEDLGNIGLRIKSFFISNISEKRKKLLYGTENPYEMQKKDCGYGVVIKPDPKDKNTWFMGALPSDRRFGKPMVLLS